MKITKTKICVLVAALALGSSITAFAANEVKQEKIEAAKTVAATVISSEEATKATAATVISSEKSSMPATSETVAATATTPATEITSMPATELTPAIVK